MPYLIGTDEAGYGPNLGPLVISASAWQVAGEPHKVDFYERLAGAVTGTGPRDPQDRRVELADSKLLYRPGSGLERLERGVLAALGLLGQQSADWRQLWDVLAPDCGPHTQQLPWYSEFRQRLPTAADAQDVEQAVALLRDVTRRAGVRLVSLRSVAVFARQFNEIVEQLGSKGAALSRLTLELLAGVLEPLDGPALVVCDKHGGRNRYAAILQEHFPEYLVEVRGESRAESVYRWGPAGRRVEISFRTGGERFMPTALASMASKYLRELAMTAFNRFWCSRVERLRPTAGYPKDARRFKAEIATVQQQLGIADRILWRER